MARRGMFDGIIRNIGDDEKKVTVSRVSKAVVIEKRNEGVQRKDNRGLTFSEAREASRCDRIAPSVYSKCQKFDPCAYGITFNRTTVTDGGGRKGVVTGRDGMNFVVLF